MNNRYFVDVTVFTEIGEVMAFVLFLYNQSLRLEIAYILYFVIAVQHIGGDCTSEELPIRS